MEKKILSLSAEGKIVVKSPEGKQYSLSSGFSAPAGSGAVVFLLIDTSGSMFGEKINQAKGGSLDFAKTALRKGYLMGLVKFDSYATLLCEPTADFSVIMGKTGELVADGGTNLTPALIIASQRLMGRGGHRVIVVATDGGPHDPVSSLQIAERMKKDGIEILAISTEDANQDFLSRLVSRKDLNLRVRDAELKRGFNLMADKLPFKAIGHKNK